MSGNSIQLLLLINICYKCLIILAQNVPNEYFNVTELSFLPRALVIPLNNNNSMKYSISGRMSSNSLNGFHSGELFAYNENGDLGCKSILIHN